MRDSIKPIMTIGRTQGSISTSDITFNESGISFNESGVTFGGFYGYSDGLYPTFSIASDFSGVGSNPATSQHTGMPMGLLLALTYP